MRDLNMLSAGRNTLIPWPSSEIYSRDAAISFLPLRNCTCSFYLV